MPLDPFHPDFRADPYPAYAVLREEEPLYRSAAQAWILSRYQDVRSALADERFGHWGRAADSSRFHTVMSRWVRLMHPGGGSCLRERASQAMSGASVDGLRAAIQTVVDQSLDIAAKTEAMDIVSDLAEPLTLTIGGRLMGIPHEELAHFHGLAGAMMPHVFNLIGGAPSGAEAPQAVRDFRECILRLAAHKRREPGNDLISAMVETEARGEAINEDDYLAFAAIFLFASHENMLNSIGNMVLTLAQHPGEWRLLQREPSLLNNALEELLRFDSPVQFVALAARQPIGIYGKQIAAGDTVLAGIGSANRDPNQFPNPDRLDFRRSSIPHLTFGAGGLYCIGAALARAEGLCVLEGLVRRFEPAGLTISSLSWRASPPVLRGLVSLPVSLKAVAQAPRTTAAQFFSGGSR